MVANQGQACEAKSRGLTIMLAVKAGSQTPGRKVYHG
jgi:hypothetical protein